MYQFIVNLDVQEAEAPLDTNHTIKNHLDDHEHPKNIAQDAHYHVKKVHVPDLDRERDQIVQDLDPT